LRVEAKEIGEEKREKKKQTKVHALRTENKEATELKRSIYVRSSFSNDNRNFCKQDLAHRRQSNANNPPNSMTISFSTDPIDTRKQHIHGTEHSMETNCVLKLISVRQTTKSETLHTREVDIVPLLTKRVWT